MPIFGQRKESFSGLGRIYKNRVLAYLQTVSDLLFAPPVQNRVISLSASQSIYWNNPIANR